MDAGARHLGPGPERSDAGVEPAVRDREGVDVEDRQVLGVDERHAQVERDAVADVQREADDRARRTARARYSSEPSVDPLSTTTISVSAGDMARVASSIGAR